jgi:hypothetical protein
MLIGKNKIQIPDNCPVNCPVRDEPFYQGNLCSRCPIFNCSSDEDGFCLIEPEDYREDWAEDFKKWFDSDFKEYPRLQLQRKVKE